MVHFQYIPGCIYGTYWVHICILYTGCISGYICEYIIRAHIWCISNTYLGTYVGTYWIHIWYPMEINVNGCSTFGIIFPCIHLKKQHFHNHSTSWKKQFSTWKNQCCCKWLQKIRKKTHFDVPHFQHGSMFFVFFVF